MTRGENPAELAGAYALNALSPEGAAEFEEYLTGSEQARIEAAELSDTAVALALALAPVQPSAGLKSSIVAKLASTPQLRSINVANSHVASAAAPLRESSATHVSATKRARARWFPRPVGILAAAAAAVALFVGGAFVGQVFNTNQLEQEQAAGLAQINAASDSQRASATTIDGYTATLVWSEELGLSAFLIDDLPALQSDKDYQLWYINGSGATSAGTFDSTGAGTVWRVLDGTLKAGDQVGVTVEQSGGSDQPTTDPIVAIST